MLTEYSVLVATIQCLTLQYMVLQQFQDAGWHSAIKLFNAVKIFIVYMVIVTIIMIYTVVVWCLMTSVTLHKIIPYLIKFSVIITKMQCK